MNITRHNYEEYFILYMDNELGSEDRRRVELFVLENPDLKTELDLLLQSRVSPDNSIVFSDKEQLMKIASTGSISMDNYEEWLLSLMDNELTQQERHQVEKFIAVNPRIKTELELLQKTKLQPETIVFPGKESLYRREKKVRIIFIQWKRIAVAASLLIAVSTTAFFLFKNNKNTGTPLADAKTEKNNAVPVIPRIETGVKEQVSTQPQVADNNNSFSEKETREKDEAVANPNVTAGKKTPQQFTTAIKQNAVAVTGKEEEIKHSNDLPQPIYNPNVNKVTDQNNPIAQMDQPVIKPLTFPNETRTLPTVTPNTTDALYTSNTSSVTNDPIDVHQPGKKNKLRGFFRKVTRTFEKNTNIKATDDEDRLLVGGLAIKL